ncbi:DNA helicase [Fusarium mexicanum]|uniref:DNA helicase n=1 Tax=Fusarium mexicanum TaxID=751941 RepID=A0A8H5MI46_9HYPO|nr:DNA helicase [Fusarium mexicanum]
MSQPTSSGPKGTDNQQKQSAPSAPSSSFSAAFNPKAGKAPEAPKAPSDAKPKGPSAVFNPCAIVIGEELFGGKAFGVSDIETKLFTRRSATLEQYLAVFIDFPLAASNEDEGFGKCHTIDFQSRSPVPCEFRRLRVKFPREIEVSFRSATQEEISKLPKTKEAMSWIEITLNKGAEISVEGFGLPFANASHPAHEWFQHPDSAHVIGGKTLLGLLQQERFSFIASDPHPALEVKMDVPSIPAKFDYGYGDVHYWDLERYMKQLSEIKGGQVEGSWDYPTDGHHVAALTQSLVQDIMWIHRDCLEMDKEKRAAYFVKKPATLKQSTRYYVIVSMGKGFFTHFAKAWARLTKDFQVKLMIYDGDEDQSEGWKARICEFPESLEVLNDHPLTAEEDELVLELQEIERKVEAVCEFLPDAAPTSLIRGESAEDSKPRSDREKLAMSLHRDIMRGDGFWKTMVAPGGMEQLEDDVAQMGINNQGKRMRLQTLPSANLLRGPNAEWIDALMTEALEVDRERFQRYLSNCPLGLGLITAGPGFGKTTAIALATLGMAASVGRVLSSGPTHVVVNNLCARIDVVTCRVTAKYNSGKQPGDRLHRALVVRGHKLYDEVAAFKKLLEKPDLGDEAAPFGTLGLRSKWKLHLSAAYWLLVCLGSDARPLHEDDSIKLHQLHKSLAESSDLARLRDRVSGKITWEEYANNGDIVGKAELEDLVQRIVEAADILCTLPALAHTEVILYKWKLQARGIAIDEAGNITRADLCSVWGNTLLPCLLAGDEKQLAPVVRTLEDEKDGIYVNRFGPDGVISPLEFIKGMGWPVYRLRTQLRLARGQFELCRKSVYKDVACTYGTGADVELASHHLGHVLEEFIRVKFPAVSPPKPIGKRGTLSPLFVSCQNSFCHVDPVTRTRKNIDQVKVAFNFLAEFVKTKQVNPADILIIAPYSAMIDVIESFYKKREYEVLKNMPPPSTVDAIQGQEADMVVVITATTRGLGPGFTSDERRLNVMLSRHKCALVIFSDIDTVDYKGKAKAQRTETPTGEVSFQKATMLREVHKSLFNAGRVAVVDCKPNRGKRKAEDEAATNA